MSKKKILIISFSNLHSDPRVRRQIEILRHEYNVSCIGYTDPKFDNIVFYPVLRGDRLKRYQNIFLKLPFNLFSQFYWHNLEVETIVEKYFHRIKESDCVIANDIDSLPVALHCANNKVPVIFDAHEYSPLEFDDRPIFRFFFQQYKTWLCKHYIPLATKMMTVSPGLVDQYESDSGKEISLVTNACLYVDIPNWSVPKDLKKIRLIHHGVALSSRKLELMIEMMDYLDSRFELNLMLVPSQKKYFEKLEHLAEGREVNFIKPVPFSRIVDEISKYDIGVYILYPSNFNNRYALPNKIFEFVQARLACAIGPSPDMKKIVNKYDLGVVAKEFCPKSMAESLNLITDDKLAFYRKQAHRHAFELSAKSNEKIILDMVDSVL